MLTFILDLLSECAYIDSCFPLFYLTFELVHKSPQFPLRTFLSPCVEIFCNVYWPVIRLLGSFFQMDRGEYAYLRYHSQLRADTTSFRNVVFIRILIAWWSRKTVNLECYHLHTPLDLGMCGRRPCLLLCHIWREVSLQVQAINTWGTVSCEPARFSRAHMSCSLSRTVDVWAVITSNQKARC
jgi:hypothetical protein